MNFFDRYFDILSQQIKDVNVEQLRKTSELIIRTSENGGKIIIAGNGGSAAIAAHMSVDFTKAANIRATCFNEPDLITCFANDYGYEHWLKKAIEFYGDQGDLVILISSSGCSENILNAAKQAREMKMSVVTFSGFKSDNPLRKLGDINFWVDSKGYNIVEMAHHIWLVAIVDHIIGKIEYSS